MSCGGPHEIPCQEVLHSLVLFIDHEIEDAQQVHQIEVHFEECPPCLNELTHERFVLERLKEMLAQSCTEEAPEALHEKIEAQTAALALQMQAQLLAAPISTQVTIQFTQVTQYIEFEEE